MFGNYRKQGVIFEKTKCVLVIFAKFWLGLLLGHAGCFVGCFVDLAVAAKEKGVKIMLVRDLVRSWCVPSARVSYGRYPGVHRHRFVVECTF